ncbi:MAG: hypothetical protein ACXU8A_00155 [Burkholderiaceae bacterium]
MNYYREVEFVSLREKNVSFVRNDVFALNKHKKHYWLQKICIRILERLDCQWQDTKVETTRIRIDPEEFMNKLYAQKAELFKQFNKDGTKLLIGAQDYEELMCSPQIHQILSFNARAYKDNDYGRQIMGLEVTVIPWMRGILVMP